MGALAAVSSWIPEDDLLLKNAVEAGASLESLAKGAVQFSRRFTVRDLQDRWYSILYDPVVSEEASIHMAEFERSFSTPSKSCRLRNTNENNCILGKRKSESVRTCYYAMRKRISSEPFNPMDLNFLVGPSSGNCNGDGEDFSTQPNTMHNENPNIYGDDFPISGNCSELEELLHQEPDNLFGANDLQAHPGSSFHFLNRDSGNISPEFGGSQVFNSPISDCDMSFQNVGCTSPVSEVPNWRTTEGISADSKEDQLMEEALALLNDDNDAMNTSISGEHMVYPGSEIKDEVSHNDLESSHALPEYFAELSSSLLDSSNDELMYTNEGEDVIHKSYYNGLSLLLSSPPQDVNGDHASGVADLDVSADSDAYLVRPNSTCPGESGEYGGPHDSDGHIACNTDVQMLPSAPAVYSQSPEPRDEIMSCAFNTEDLDIPCNDDIFLPTEMPLLSPSIVPQGCPEPLNLMSSTYKGISDKRGPGLMRREPENLGLPHAFSQKVGSKKLQETASDYPFGDSGANHGLPNANSQHVGSWRAGIACGNRSQNTSVNVNLKAETVEIQLARPAGCDSSECSTQLNAKCSEFDIDAGLKLRDYKAPFSKQGSVDISVPQPAVNPSTLNQEECLSESEDEIPYFSDVEAMILDMDLGPNGQDMDPSRKALSCQHEESKKAIVRLEQGAHSYMQRAIASHGAFAVLYGRHSKYYIKKPEVLLGRATEDVEVDIDLGKEGHGNRISRRQATIKTDDNGAFTLTNLGKSCVSVNDREIVSGQCLVLHPGCLVEIRGMPFIFQANRTCVKRYLEKKITQRRRIPECNV